MKVLQMARWFFPHVGGASIRVYNIAKYLTKFGYEVHLLVHNPKSIEQCNLDEESPLYEKHPDGFYVYRLPYYDLPVGKNFFNWGISIPLMAKKAIEIINKNKIDAILSENPPYLIGAASLIASKITKKPIIIDAQDIWGASHYSFIKYKIGSFLERMCVKRAEKLIVPCEGIDDVLIRRYKIKKEKFAVAYNGVDVDRFKPIKLTDSQKEEIYKILEDKKINQKLIDKFKNPNIKKILFLGILAPWSGCKYFIRAAEKVVKKNSETLFIVIGHGIQYSELVEKTKELGIDENLMFTRTLPPKILPKFLNLVDICVSPFPKPEKVGREDIMPIRPISTLEFLSCGKPVIMSDVPGARNLIKDMENGLLFQAENVDDLANKIEYLLKNPELAKKIGESARKFVLGGNKWNDTAKVVERVLKESLMKK